MTIAAKKNELLQTSPILSFWQVDEIRVVDFGDPEVEGPTAGTIRFDGEDWVPGKLSISARSESTEGGETDVTVSIADPYNEIAKALHAVDGLAGSRVTVRHIRADEISDPSKASSQFFIVRSPTITDQGIAFLLGNPSQIALRTPSKVFSRGRCWNRFGKRHELGNACTYPSDFFTNRTKQRYKTALSIAGEQEWRFGWRTINATNSSTFESAYTVTSAFLKAAFEIESFSGAARWLDANREGPFLFRMITGDFDVEAWINIQGGLSRPDFMFGILAQGATDQTSWFYLGRGLEASIAKIRARVTTASVSADTEVAASNHRYLRLVRTGNSWEAYSKLSSGASWSLVHSTTLALDAQVRLGLFYSGETAATTLGGGQAGYFWFHSGGETTCDRTLARCRVLGNTNDFNGFTRMPDVRSRV